MSDSVRTKKGTELPLMNLKGKKYLMVAYRIQWFTEEEPRFSIDTEFLKLDDEQTVCKATICTYDENGKLVRKATSTKRETKKDFPDHTEKAETGAIGRALIELGYGTQFALSDLDEGNRLADSPLAPVKQSQASASGSTTPEPLVAKTTTTQLVRGSENTAPLTNSDLKVIEETLEIAKRLSEQKTISVPGAIAPMKRSSFRKDKQPAPKATPATIGEQPGETEWN